MRRSVWRGINDPAKNKRHFATTAALEWKVVMDMRLIDADTKVSDCIVTWQCECSENGKQTAMAVEDLQYLPTIDPIRAVGGCWCGECKYRESIDGSNDYCALHETLCSKFCGDGKLIGGETLKV